jgi:hypothetical protein
MTAILFVQRTGWLWNAFKATGICSSSSAHRRFVEGTEAGVFVALAVDGRRKEQGASRREKKRTQPHRPSEARPCGLLG